MLPSPLALSSLHLLYLMQSLLYQMLPSFLCALPGPNHIQASAMSR